ncbi:unnamed protein product [Adineta steineri]|uniref:Uncharacterized protein n=1 Tax=Adineta steineri TaxID=433720 RepID=A0A815J985_9BILA|nr:unnamed protein product [Adineta steineri]
MFGINTILLVTIFSICHVQSMLDENCPVDNVDFETKVANSSIVVYGKATETKLYDGSDSTFFVKFRVDCILKGPVINHLINITKAGRVENKTYCQSFSVGRGHVITFLEPDPLHFNDSKSFIPTDFVEIQFQDNVTNELLANTCNLHQLLPFQSTASIADACPIVSTESKCIHTTMKTDLELTSSSVLISGKYHHGSEDIRSKSGTIQVDVDTKNGVNRLNISILLILMTVFVRLY